MTVTLQLIFTLLIGAASMAGAAVLRNAVRNERPAFLPWLKPWGILCAVPALLFLCFCIPDRDEVLRLLETAGFEPGWEVFAGAAGVLPGLMWDEIAERLEKRPGEPFAVPAWLMRALLVAGLSFVLAIPYGFVFAKREPAPSTPPAEAQENALPSAD